MRRLCDEEVESAEHMATMSGTLGGTTPYGPWLYDGQTRPPSMRSSSPSEDHPQVPTITTTATLVKCRVCVTPTSDCPCSDKEYTKKLALFLV